MKTTDAGLLIITAIRELNALALAYKRAKDEGRTELSDEEVASFATRAQNAGDRLQAKIDSVET